MLSILGAILGAGMKWVLSYFMPSKDEKLGRLEVSDKEKTDALDDIKKADDARAAVKSDGVLDDVENRDR